MKLKLKMFMAILVRIKKYLTLVIILLGRNIMMNQVVGKMKDDMGGVVIEGIVLLKPKIYSILVSDSSMGE